MLTELFLAGRYLRPRRNAVSLITLTSIIGVMLGVTVLMVVLAVMTGFTDLMKAKLIETQAHFQVRLPGYAMSSSAFPEQVLKELGVAAAPVIQGPVLVQYARNQLDPQVVVLGVDSAALGERLGLDSPEVLIAGRNELEGRHAVISYDMARRWGVGVGDRILLHSAKRLTSLVNFKREGGVELNPEASAYLPGEFVVSGIYRLGKYDFDRAVFFISADDAAELFDLPWGAATSIYCWGQDPFDQDKLVEKVRSRLAGYVVTTWQEENRQLLDVLAVEKRMMFFLLIFIVLVAAFSIANTLITSVYQKTREIGLLKALGASDGMVTRVFVAQGFLIGAIGSIAGTLLGWLVIIFRNDIMHLVSRIGNIELFPKEFYYFNELPAHIVTGDVVFIVVSSIVLCTLGALLPACRAARLDPAKSLRYE